MKQFRQLLGINTGTVDCPPFTSRFSPASQLYALQGYGVVVSWLFVSGRLLFVVGARARYPSSRCRASLWAEQRLPWRERTTKVVRPGRLRAVHHLTRVGWLGMGMIMIMIAYMTLSSYLFLCKYKGPFFKKIHQMNVLTPSCHVPEISWIPLSHEQRFARNFESWGIATDAVHDILGRSLT